MIFFINNSGTITNNLPEQVYQGSANANSIYLVAPFARNMTATVAFGLPNGVFTEPYNLAYTGEITGFTDEQGTTYYGWSMEIPNDITVLYGTVIAQFTFYSGNRRLATSSTTFTVGRGVPTILPETPTEDVYEQILQLISTIQQDLGNGYYSARAVYAWNSTYKYGANELVYYPMDEYGVYVKSLVANNTQPPYSNGVIGSNWLLVVDFNDIMKVRGDVDEAVAIAQQSAKEAAASASSAASSEGSAAQSAAKALNQATAAQASAEAAASSEKAAEESATEVREALGKYYTKIEIDAGVAKTFEASINNTTYEITFVLKSADGTVLSQNVIDLPLESVVVSGSYDQATKSIILTLQNGQTVSIPIGDLVDGLASQEALDNVIAGTTPVAKAVRADTAANADNAEKVTNSLTIITDGVPTQYNGEAAKEIVINTTSSTDPEAVHFNPQNLTTEQQAQARANINAQIVGESVLLQGDQTIGGNKTFNDSIIMPASSDTTDPYARLSLSFGDVVDEGNSYKSAWLGGIMTNRTDGYGITTAVGQYRGERSSDAGFYVGMGWDGAIDKYVKITRQGGAQVPAEIRCAEGVIENNLIIDTYSTNKSYDEGIRINSDTEWATISLGTNRGTIYGSDTNKGMIIGRPANADYLVISGHGYESNDATRMRVTKYGEIFDRGERVYSPNNPPPLYSHNIVMTGSPFYFCSITIINNSPDVLSFDDLHNYLAEKGFNIPAKLYPASGGISSGPIIGLYVNSSYIRGVYVANTVSGEVILNAGSFNDVVIQLL